MVRHFGFPAFFVFATLLAVAAAARVLSACGTCGRAALGVRPGLHVLRDSLRELLAPAHG